MKRRAALMGSLAALTPATSARADTPVDLQLVLAVDVSRSIDEVEAELQRRAYAEEMTNDGVMDATRAGDNRRTAVSYPEGAGPPSRVVVIDWTLIDSPPPARR